jgi:hypothetical protein
MVGKEYELNILTEVSFWFQVTWSLSSENKYKPSGFKLFYGKMNSEKFGPINLDANTTQYLLGNLGKAV